MDTIQIVYDLLDFLLETACYYLPCLIGSLIGHFVKYDVKKIPKPKKKKNKLWSFFIAPSLLPAVLMVIITHSLTEYFNNGAVTMAIAVILGGIGEEISILLTPRGLVALIKLVVKGAEAINDIENTLSALEDNDSKAKPKDDHHNSNNI